MSYISLYRKYRSQTFNDVIGQEHIVRTIRNAIKSSKIGQAYLFCGSRGTGKTTVARLIAKALNCMKEDKTDPEPCNICESCTSITAGSAIDVVEMDAASNRGVDDVDALRGGVKYSPMRLRYKVYIIDEAHQLSSAAKDAFLKTLEEPPPHAIFILATTEAHKIPVTIRSRCQQFDFRRGALSDISARLKHVVEGENASIDDKALELLARAANGSYRDSLSLLEQVLAFTEGEIRSEGVYNVLGMVDEDALLELADVIANADASEAFTITDKLLREGRDVRELVKSAAEFFRDLLMLQVGADKLHADNTRWVELSKKLTQKELIHIVEIFANTEKELRWNEHHRLALEIAMLTAMQKPSPTHNVPAVLQESTPVQQIIHKPQTRPQQPERSAQPAPEAASEAPDIAPATYLTQGEALTLTSLGRLWPRITLRLRKDMRETGLVALLANSDLLSLKDDTLELGFISKYEFHRNGVEKKSQIVSQAIEDITGVRLRVLAVSVPAAENTVVRQTEPIQQSITEEHPLINDVMLEFDGEIIENDSSDPWKEH